MMEALMAAISFATWEPSSVQTFSRLAIIAAWGYALLRTWSVRHFPKSNQILAGAGAMILSQAALLWAGQIPYDVLVFFVALAHCTLVSAFVQVLGVFGSVRQRVCGRTDPLYHPTVAGLLAFSAQTVLTYFSLRV